MSPIAPPFLPDIGPPAFVLDAAVAAAWVLPDIRSTYPGEVIRRMPRTTATVPMSWPTDLADLLRAGERKGRMTGSTVDAKLDGFRDFRIVIDTESPLRWWPAVLVGQHF